MHDHLDVDNLEPVFSLDDKESIHFAYERKKGRVLTPTEKNRYR
jgi:hypothetical protein